MALVEDVPAGSFLKLTGELLIIAAATLLLYVVYELFFTNVKSDAVATEIAQELRTRFDSEPASPQVSSLAAELDAYALLYIPALGNDAMGVPILLGTSERQLASGVGQYEESESPGEVGNLAIAGHRATFGEPFARFELLSQGDQVFIETERGWFVYELKANQKIANDEVWVIADHPEVENLSSDRLLTLTTCDPRWNSTRRWAWWGEFKYFSETSPIGVNPP